MAQAMKTILPVGIGGGLGTGSTPEPSQTKYKTSLRLQENNLVKVRIWLSGFESTSFLIVTWTSEAEEP